MQYVPLRQFKAESTWLRSADAQDLGSVSKGKAAAVLQAVHDTSLLVLENAQKMATAATAQAAMLQLATPATAAFQRRASSYQTSCSILGYILAKHLAPVGTSVSGGTPITFWDVGAFRMAEKAATRTDEADRLLPPGRSYGLKHITWPPQVDQERQVRCAAALEKALQAAKMVTSTGDSAKAVTLLPAEQALQRTGQQHMRRGFKWLKQLKGIAEARRPDDGEAWRCREIALHAMVAAVHLTYMPLNTN